MAPEQSVAKPVKDRFKCEVFSLGVILFRMIFKAYPYAPSAYEDPASQNSAKFLEQFIKSPKNVHKVNIISESLKKLLIGMLAYD